MKRLLLRVTLFILAYIVADQAMAQQDPYYTHFMFNKQSYNPAAAGPTKKLICVNGIYHQQWLGYDDNTPNINSGPDAINDPNGIVENVAPVTYALNIGTPVELANGRHVLGVGVSFYDDKVSYLKTTAFKAQVNYRIPIQGQFSYLAVGPELGLIQAGYDQPNFISVDQGDPNIPISGGSAAKFDMGFGLYYHQDRLGAFQDFNAGLSMTHLIPNTYSISVAMQDGQQGNLDYDLESHMYFIADADYRLNTNLVLEPGILVKYKVKPQIDVNATVLWNNMIRGGVNFRQWGNTDALSLMVGYQKNHLKVGYAYDITISKVRFSSSGTHELMAAYCFKLKTAPDDKERETRRTPRFL